MDDLQVNARIAEAENRSPKKWSKPVRGQAAGRVRDAEVSETSRYDCKVTLPADSTGPRRLTVDLPGGRKTFDLGQENPGHPAYPVVESAVLTRGQVANLARQGFDVEVRKALGRPEEAPAGREARPGVVSGLEGLSPPSPAGDTGDDVGDGEEG